MYIKYIGKETLVYAGKVYTPGDVVVVYDLTIPWISVDGYAGNQDKFEIYNPTPEQKKLEEEKKENKDKEVEDFKKNIKTTLSEKDK